MTDQLDDFLKSEPPAEVTETPEAQDAQTEAEAQATEPAAEEPKGPARDDKGRFAPKGETEAAPPAAEETHSIPPKALQEERRKRQELEAQLAELQARLQQPQQPAPSIWEDEQGWQQHFGSEVTSQAVQAATMNARLDMSEMMVRQAHPDFDDKKAAFLEMMRDTPGLQQKALAEPHPWQFAYQYVSNHQRMQELAATNVAELEAKLREQIKAELAAEVKQPAPTPQIPDTLADAQSARGSSGATLNIPSLDQILGRA